MSLSRLTLGAALAAATPAAALAQTRLNAVMVFNDAAPSMKLIMLALILASLAAIAITVRKAMSGPHLSGGSTYLSALRLGGPLIGLLGAAYNGLNIAIGVSNVKPESLDVIWPGVAELMSLITLGLVAGVIAVICHAIVEARIDRAVLRS